MNFKLIKKLIPCIILLAAVMSMTSCNRGMGCPTFSVDQVVKTVDQVSNVMIVKE